MHTRQRARIAYLFLAPFFLTFLTFSVFPILYSLYISFCNFDPLGGGTTWVGWANYARLFTSSYFFESIVNTLVIWIFSIVPQLTLALLLALLLNNTWLKGKNVLRCLYYFPNLVTPVTVGVLFGILFSSPGGTVNLLLRSLHLTDAPIAFSLSPLLSRMVIGLALCWMYFGYNVIFFTAGLNAIPRDVYEAAEVDGATPAQKTLRITLPLMKPILVYIMVTSIIGGLQIFDVSKLVFTDVPGNKTTTMVQYMYTSAFERWQLGFGAACAYGIFLIIALFSLVSLRLTQGRKDALTGGKS